MKEKLWVIVTGGTRGIGRGITCHLIEKGYGVHAFYVKDEQTATDLLNIYDNGCLSVHKINVSYPDQIKNFFQFRDKEPEIVALVNCAGVYVKDEDGPENLERVLSTNILGPFNTTLAFLEYRKNGALSQPGAVINIGSTSALHGPTGSAIYAASKAGLHRLATVMAKQFAGILSINTIAPGPVLTEMLTPTKIDLYIGETPTIKLTQPEEIGSLAEYLISQRANNIVGAVICLDGGRIQS